MFKQKLNYCGVLLHNVLARAELLCSGVCDVLARAELSQDYGVQAKAELPQDVGVQAKAELPTTVFKQ